MSGRFVWSAALLALALAGVHAAGQAGSPPPPLTLPQAVAAAFAHYPAVLAAARQADAATAAVALKRAEYLPDFRLVAQEDRASDNNTPGLLIANGLPTISGPVAAHFTWSGFTTSSGGAIFAWEAFDFGRRAAGVDFYRALAARAAAQSREAQLEAGAHAADVYLAALAAAQGVRVAAADIARWQTLDRTVHVLVNQQLRPGADASRADAELAAAQLGQVGAQDQFARQLAALAEAVGAPAADIQLAGDDLLQHVPAPPPPAAAAPTPPLLEAQAQAVLASQFALLQSVRGDRPRFALLASGYGRGTSVLSGARNLAVWDGAAPFSAGNWVVGVGVEFSLSRHWQSQREQAVFRRQQQVETARYQQVQGALTLAQRQAAADLDAARLALEYAPVELTAARTGEAQARARYSAGLSSIVDLANAEELLVKAETDDILSRIQIWRAQLKVAFAQGDLTPFLRAAVH